MTHTHIIAAVLAFALGVLITDTAHDYRNRALITPPEVAAPAPAPQAPYICAHRRLSNVALRCGEV